MEQGKLEAAVEAAENALKLKPDYSEALRLLGRAMDQWGRKDQALEYYRRLLQHNPYDLNTIYRMIRMGCKELPQLAQRVQYVLDNDPDLPPQLEKSLHFTLGAAQEKQGNHRKAMAFYLAAGKLHHQEAGHEETESLFRRIQDAFTAERFQQLEGANPCAESPIFIIGLPHSGSTLTESLLATSDHIQVIGESAIMPSISRFGGQLLKPEQSYPDWVKAFPADQWAGLAQYYLRKARQTAQSNGHLRIVGKNLGNLVLRA